MSSLTRSIRSFRYYDRFSLFRAISMFEAAYYTGLSSPAKCTYTTAQYPSNKTDCSNDVKNAEIKSTYEEAIQALNCLQSNAVTIQQSIQRQRSHIDDTLKYLKRINITPDKLDKLSVIHVSGTKGKGSTCALTESILRSFNIKTGFFSSPHLISVTERIRLNGKAINKEMFSNYFWKCYEPLNELKEDDQDMPAYFKFLTILSYYIFIEENVDVAIIEVGIGGENDATNIVRNTKTVGITSLGLEHTNLLGDTLSDIAWQKAGIIKFNSNVFTSSQPEECIKVIKQRADEKHAKLFIAPNFTDYKWERLPNLQVNNVAQQYNASLAIQLAYDWLKTNKLQNLNGLKNKLNLNGITLDVCEEIVNGLENCFWPGRCQLIIIQNKSFFLDGAHTKESIEICCDWFKKSTDNNNKNKKYLIFNTTGDRDNKNLLKILSDNVNFVKVFFTPNTPFVHKKMDDINSSWYSHETQMQRVLDNYEFWSSINNEYSAVKCNNILEALINLNNEIKELDSKNDENVDILVTGSLHLIGSTLLALEEYENKIVEHLNK